MEEVRLVVVVLEDVVVVVVLDFLVLIMVMVVLLMVMVLVLVLAMVLVSSPKEEGRWPAVAIACCIAAACNKKYFTFFSNKSLNSSGGRIFRLHICVICVFVYISILLSS